MAQPIWITPAGSLGTVPEGIFYQQPMLADTAVLPLDITCTATSATTNLITCNSTAGLWQNLNVMFVGTPFGGISNNIRYFVFEIIDATHFSIAATERDTAPIQLTNGTGSLTANFTQHVYFTLQAGNLPAGVSISDNGLIVGVPKAVASIQGVPAQVAIDVTSKFTVRAYTTKPVNNVLVLDRLADRTFSITVTGQNVPEFVTPAGQIGTYYDGSFVSFQIEYSDPDPGDTIITRVAAGSLPAGLTISTSGLISGFITPIVPITIAPGFSRDNQGFDQYPLDFSKRSGSTNYQFTLEVTDGKGSNIRTFSMYVYSRDSMVADTTDFTADNTFITTDESPVRVPYIANFEPSNIGTYRNDNFFAYQFIGVDPDGDPIEFFNSDDSVGLELPPGLQLDNLTGWLYGYIPDTGNNETTYTFAIRIAKKNNPDVTSDPYHFTMTLTGQVNTDVTWISDANLGTIDNGGTSLFTVEAVNTGGRTLLYRLKPGGYPVVNTGVYNNLPQGLQLLPSGNIAGRVSFNTFALDGGTTTFDKNLRTRLSIDETTFDMSHTFTVNAYSSDGLVSSDKTFTITVVRKYNEPYENLYIQAMPPLGDRALISQMLQNSDAIPPSLVFRDDDPNFGVAKSVIYDHAFGLTSSTLDDYVASLEINHYWKNLTLGEITTAQATDASGNVIYEVVYSKIIDNLVNNEGQSVSKEVTLPYPIDPGDSTEVSTVYPNSLVDMRDQVIDTVGKVGEVLPLWMLSKQANGQVLGFTPAWVICYVKPGQSARVAYNLNSAYSDQLNKVDFEVDRYELDRLLSIHWDPSAVPPSWEPTPAETTFDELIITSEAYWQNYLAQYIVWINNLNHTVLWGNADPGQPTTFDGNSMKFISPVDMYSDSTAFDKYLVFPRRNILG